ncbi:MAG: response regulator transcription factor [Novosphingobium sp.]
MNLLDDRGLFEFGLEAEHSADNPNKQQNNRALLDEAFSSPRMSSIYIVASKATVRAAMARLVAIAGYRVAEFAEPEELIDLQPEYGIVIIHESSEQGAAAMCSALLKKDMWLPVIGFGTDISARRVIDGMKAGAVDFIVGQITASDLQTLLERSERNAKARYDRHRRRAEARQQLSKLSKREREVLDLVASGLSSKEAAKELELSHRTVEIHRLRVLSKLGASTAAHAVSIASAASI